MGIDDIIKQCRGKGLKRGSQIKRKTPLKRGKALNPVSGIFKKQPKVRGYKSSKCILDHWHQSRKEAEYCTNLELLKRSGEIREFKTQRRIDLIVNNVRIGAHDVDFEVVNNDGSIEWHEVKGFATEVWRIKYKLTKALYPETPYIVIT